jgi:hypothetical protein
MAFCRFNAVDSSTEASETVRFDIYGLRVIFPLGPAYLKGIWYGGTNPGNYGDTGTTGLKYRTMLLPPRAKPPTRTWKGMEGSWDTKSMTW